jgi:hypothetical protein
MSRTTLTIHARLKHIQRRFHFIQQAYLNRDVNLELIPATDQAADVLTKSLQRGSHQHAIELLNLKSLPFDSKV